MGTLDWAALGQAAPADVAATLRDADPAALVRAIRTATDEEILAVGHDAERGPAVVEGVMRRIGDVAVPDRLAATRGWVRWDSATRARESWHLDLQHGAAEVAPAGRRSGAADVVVRGTDLQLLRLVAGQLDVAAELLADRIGIDGSGDLAIATASLFAVDGTDPVTGTPVDVRDIDPVAIARALHGVPAAHLRAVLASDFRPVVLEEVFGRMPSFVNGRKAAGVQVTVGFRLTGRPDGEVDRYVLRLSDGRASVLSGTAADAVPVGDRDATVTCEAADFLRLVTGHLSAVSGVLRGQLKVRGDKVAALRLNAAFDIPTAAAG
ncbi:SCP2 sterol-binding domain-containing protein [Nocardioides sp. J54]|uniref:SCP2 sterol-binding domain-containing protein n=1 Tax=Nocardioides sp. J54 TaxID=935866 RepID=UPI00048A8862|nr:SCP2 sterol-binding domain-containing protein [Nocardioides sp. J54]